MKNIIHETFNYGLVNLRPDHVIFSKKPGFSVAKSFPRPTLSKIRARVNQGDQIGRIFAHWALVVFGQLFENYRSSPYFWAIFPRKKLCIDFNKKWVWATFWAIFSQTHLVTLVSTHT
jgi:hypothetical protein